MTARAALARDVAAALLAVAGFVAASALLADVNAVTTAIFAVIVLGWALVTHRRRMRDGG